MASRTASCPWCSAPFSEWGEDGTQAQQRADAAAANHAMNCPSNPANQE